MKKLITVCLAALVVIAVSAMSGSVVPSASGEPEVFAGATGTGEPTYSVEPTGSGWGETPVPSLFVPTTYEPPSSYVPPTTYVPPKSPEPAVSVTATIEIGQNVRVWKINGAKISISGTGLDRVRIDEGTYAKVVGVRVGTADIAIECGGETRRFIITVKAKPDADEQPGAGGQPDAIDQTPGIVIGDDALTSFVAPVAGEPCFGVATRALDVLDNEGVSVGTVEPGVIVNVISTGDGKLEVTTPDGATGTVDEGDVAQFGGYMKLVKATHRVIKLRKGPGTSYNIVGYAKMGEVFAVIGEENGWYLVAYEGKTCYTSAEYYADEVVDFTGYSEFGSAADGVSAVVNGVRTVIAK